MFVLDTLFILSFIKIRKPCIETPFKAFAHAQYDLETESIT